MTSDFKRLAQRASAAFGALGLGTFITIASVLSPAVATVGAFPTGGQVQSRAIYMSTSTPNATNQTYLVAFKPANPNSIKGVIVDFCSSSNSPIIGDSCTAPTAFSVGTPTVTFANTTVLGGDPVDSTGLLGSWTAASLNSGRTLKLTAAAGSGALTTSTTYSFAITTVHNPSTTGTFYARIITYTSDTGDIAAYTDTTPGSTDALDYGGFALSTVTNVSVTAKVQESLTFCASGGVDQTSTANMRTNPFDDATGNDDCTDATAPAVLIGHGTPLPGVIDNTAVDANPAFTMLSTNATNGAVVRMHASNACANGGLSHTGGASCAIPGVGSLGGNTQTAANPVVAGTTFFGLLVKTGTSITAHSSVATGSYAPDSNYNDGNVNTAAPATVHYGMDTTSGTQGVTSTYGDAIASTSGGPCSYKTNELWFAATAALNVPAGIYTGSESLIATGTF